MHLLSSTFKPMAFLLLVLFCLSISVSAAEQNNLKGVRAWPSPDNTRVVLDLTQKPHYETHYLTRPDRLVIDLSTTTNKAKLKDIVSNSSILKNVRVSASGKSNTFRLVLDLKQASKARIFSLPPAKPYGHRLVIDLPHKKEEIKVPQAIAAAPEGRDIIVAIDAGHGGDDPGALGKYTYEKKVTLQIAKRLKTKIDSQKGMQAFLVRTGDYFVNLNKRSDIARKGKADFLVSIHADGFTSSRPRGASVWVLSNRRATSELGRWMEKHEAHSELLGGAGDIIQDSDSVPFLNKMLLDMSMGNTMDVGYAIGHLVTNELSKVTKMHKKKPVHASLAVLKSPDIPSILVEAGFITNRTEERLLNQAEFQNKIANAVYTGIYKHFSQTPPQGSLFAQKKRVIKHTVRSGESLSILAKRYSVSSSQLKKVNHLTSSSLRIGQVLKIPANYHVVVKPEPTKTRLSPAYTAPKQAVIHIVRRGESLSVIASKYDKTTTQLKSHNKLRSTSLAIGQKIKIPGVYVNSTVASSQPVTAPTKTVVEQERIHKVQRGESLSGIASQYDKTTAQLKSHNKLRSTSLAIGQRIKIPGVDVTVAATAPPKPTTRTITTKKERVHQVQRGESLSGIASKYNKSTAQVKSHNKLRTTTLAIGQKLKIPGVYVTVVSTVPVDTSTAIAATTKTVTTKKERVHKVRSGESLSGIASKYNKSTAQLKSHNKLRSTSLAIGQKLKIPGVYVTVVSTVPVDTPTAIAKSFRTAAPTTKTVTTKKERVHKVRSGESLSGIASKYNTSTAKLKSHNKLRSTSLSIGQKLKVPGVYVSVVSTVPVDTSPKASTSTATPTKTVTTKKERVHKVRSGESLSGIASKYNTSTAKLKSHNKLRSTSLSIGQKLNIPGVYVSVVSTVPASTNIVEQQKEQVHKVKSGESLSVIASRYDKTTTELKQYNKLRSTRLSVGQKLKIPALDRAYSVGKSRVPNAQKTSPQRVSQYKVKSGDSLSVIAQRFDRTSQQIKTYNNLRTSSLSIGQTLKIPTANYAAPAKPEVHTVKSGQSLSVIAQKYGTTSQQLKVHNKLRSSSLAIGQKLKIPTKKIKNTKHRVRSGESLSVIAKRYGTTTNAIVKTNKLRSKSLSIGQVLTIPIS